MADPDPGALNKIDAVIRVSVHRIVAAARGIQSLAVRRPDQTNMRVELLDHLPESRVRLVGARHVVKEDELGGSIGVDHTRGID